MQTLTEEGLKAILAQIASRPLYSPLSYLGAESVEALPMLVVYSCGLCGKEQVWETTAGGESKQNRGGRFHQDVGLTSATYRCRSCQKRHVHIYLKWHTFKVGGRQHSQLMKVGQDPPIQEVMDPLLEKALDDKDREYYRSALRCRNLGMGIAAVSYMRRIVGNRINDLLDLIVRAVEDSHEEGLQHIKTQSVSERIDLASKLLPVRLKPGGKNPLGGLYAVTSDALQQGSEDECIEDFDLARVGFEYLFCEIRAELERSTNYTKSLDALNKSRPPGP